MTADPPDAGAQDERPLLEIGWVLDRRLEQIDTDATKAAIDTLADWLRERFPRFEWRLVVVVREIVQAQREPPVTLLEVASSELSLHHWDFAIAVTSSDLATHSRTSARAVSSRALGAGVISTFRIDPMAEESAPSPEQRARLIAHRVRYLALGVLGHLGGLPMDEDGDGLVSAAVLGADAPDVDFDEQQAARLGAGLARVADARVEEQAGNARGIWFAVRSIVRARREILDNVRGSRCWEFPFRLGRLSTAAVSALAIVSMTAEAWDLGMALHPATAIGVAVLAILTTSFYVLSRQQLLSPMRFVRQTEQSVVTSASIVLFVVLGMTTIYLVLLVTTWAVSSMLFDPEIVARWTGRDPAGVDGLTYAVQAVFVSSVAVLVGALGASFEGQRYVKHVALGDAEI